MPGDHDLTNPKAQFSINAKRLMRDARQNATIDAKDSIIAQVCAGVKRIMAPKNSDWFSNS